MWKNPPRLGQAFDPGFLSSRQQRFDRDPTLQLA